MPSDDIKERAEGELFIREFHKRLFVVLRYGDKEFLKGLPIGVRTWGDAQTRRHIDKVVRLLMEISGVRNIRVSDCIDESLN